MLLAFAGKPGGRRNGHRTALVRSFASFFDISHAEVWSGALVNRIESGQGYVRHLHALTAKLHVISERKENAHPEPLRQLQTLSITGQRGAVENLTFGELVDERDTNDTARRKKSSEAARRLACVWRVLCAVGNPGLTTTQIAEPTTLQEAKSFLASAAVDDDVVQLLAVSPEEL